MQELGWIEGRNIRFDIRWDTGTVDGARKVAAELVALSPDVILASGSASLTTLQTRRDVPIVFTIAPDPVGAGFIDSLARPGANIIHLASFDLDLLLALDGLRLLRKPDREYAILEACFDLVSVEALR
jgi:putative tryptophan/tyrosine transport system substrate-binding protein